MSEEEVEEERYASGADPGIFDWGVQTLVQKGRLDSFEAHYFPPTPLPTTRGCTL